MIVRREDNAHYLRPIETNRGHQEPAESEIFTYKDPPKAGTGSYDDEMRRYNLFMSSQGVICQNIRHFGGMYMQNKNPPEFDPDGSWYLCLDPEVALRPGSCIVYSIGYVLSYLIIDPPSE